MRLHKPVAVLVGTVVTLVAAPAGTAVADPPGTKPLMAGQTAETVALGPGQAFMAYKPGNDRYVARIPVSRSGTQVTVGSPSVIGAGLSSAWLSASANRVLYGRGVLRYEGSNSTTLVSPNVHVVIRLSGNRALFYELGNYIRWPALYNIRTGARNAPFGSGVDRNYPVDLWGEYFAYALPNGAVYRRDLRTGTTVQVRPPGSPIRAVSVYAARVAWVTACPSSGTCNQTLSWRTVGAGPVTNVAVQDTAYLRLGGARVAFDNVFGGVRTLSAVELGSHNAQVIATSAANYRPTFDLYDETIGWVIGGQAKVAPLPAHKESPRYLGNAIAPASFHPPALWRAGIPLSKPLTDCRVTFRKNGTPVRIIGCAATTKTGLATVAWNGKTGSGKPVSKGTYTWTLTGSDSDGKLLWYNGSGSVIAGTVNVT